MATYRIGIGSFNLKDNAVGIGTESSGLGNLKVEGTVKTTDLDVTGVSTFTRYAGFAADELSISRDVTLTGEHSTTGDIVVGVNSTFTVSVGATVDIGTVPSVSIGTHFSLPTGGMEDRPEAVHEGMVRFNEDLNTLEFYNGLEWRQFTVTNSRGRGIHAGGATPTPADSHTGFMSVFEMATLGNAKDFGDLLKHGQGHAGCASETRGLFGGRVTPSASPDDDIEYLTMASGGQTIFFGNMSSGRRLGASFSSSTRGLWACGITPSRVNVIDYVEISTLGDAVDFGDAMNITATMSGCSSPTRGIFGSGRITSPATLWMSRVEDVTIASKGNSTKFGDLTVATASHTSFSNSVRGFWAGGHTNPNYDSIVPGPIDYITIATGGNAVRFGDLPSKRSSMQGCASQTRGFIMGGYGVESPVFTNAIDYVTIVSEGNSMDFGDLVMKLESGGACSDSHGGLGGY